MVMAGWWMSFFGFFALNVERAERLIGMMGGGIVSVVMADAVWRFERRAKARKDMDMVLTEVRWQSVVLVLVPVGC
ncbi:hypothetical protein EDD85DRAFT_849771, partial [Armillaria nabsnona]